MESSATTFLSLPNCVLDNLIQHLDGRHVLALRAVHSSLRGVKPAGVCPKNFAELIEALSSTPSPRLIDLCGRVLKGKTRQTGVININTPGLSIRDGTFELAMKDELVLQGNDIHMEKVTFRRVSGTKSKRQLADEVGRRGLRSVRTMLRMEGAKGVQMVDCMVHGLLEVGRGGVAELRQCLVHGPVRISRTGSHMIAIDSEFLGSPVNGLFVDPTCALDMEGCRVHGHAASGLIACADSFIVMRACELLDNACHALACFGAQVALHDCVLRGNGENALDIDSSAAVNMDSCKVFGGRKPPLRCGHGCNVRIHACYLDQDQHPIGVPGGETVVEH